VPATAGRLPRRWRRGALAAFGTAAGDPRPSVAERYRSGADYVAAVEAAANQLVAERLLLAEDAERYIERARKEPRVAP